MELKKINIEGREVTFVNEARDTRHGFAHDTTVFINNRQVAKNTAHYLNRTWECYRFQTVMLGAIYTLIEEAKAEVKAQFMAEKGYGRLTAKRAEELERVYAENADIRFYEAIRTNLKGY